MPKTPEEYRTEYPTLPIVLNGELTDIFDSPNLLDGEPEAFDTTGLDPSSEVLPPGETDQVLPAAIEATHSDILPAAPNRLSLRDRMYA